MNRAKIISNWRASTKHHKKRKSKLSLRTLTTPSIMLIPKPIITESNLDLSKRSSNNNVGNILSQLLGSTRSKILKILWHKGLKISPIKTTPNGLTQACPWITMLKSNNYLRKFSKKDLKYRWHILNWPSLYFPLQIGMMFQVTLVKE